MLDPSVWILAALLAAAVGQDTTAGPQIMLAEPLVAGVLSGYLFGDVGTGLLTGIAAQLIWSGAVPAGSSVFLDVHVGTVAAVATAVLAKGGGLVSVVSFLWILPVGLVGGALTHMCRKRSHTLGDGLVRDLDAAGPGSIAARHLTGWLVAGLRGMVTFFLGVAAGVPVVAWLAAHCELWVSPGLAWAGVLGAGVGASVVAAYRRDRLLSLVLGAAAALSAWVVGVLPEGW